MDGVEVVDAEFLGDVAGEVVDLGGDVVAQGVEERGEGVGRGGCCVDDVVADAGGVELYNVSDLHLESSVSRHVLLSCGNPPSSLSSGLRICRENLVLGLQRSTALGSELLGACC